MNGITVLGLQMLKESNWIAIPNDKDSGYTLELKDDIIAIHDDIIGKKEYKEIPIYTVKKANEETVRRCAKIAKQIEVKTQRPGMMSAIMRTVRNPKASTIIILKTTCKTHQPQTKIPTEESTQPPNTACLVWVRGSV